MRDVIIVGGGTAGCILASRLSEDPAVRVLLIEAGPDLPPDAVPADIASVEPRAHDNPFWKWPQRAFIATRTTSPSTAISIARVLGGGSSLMGMIALRGTPDDYAEWHNAGAEGWDWDSVLPYFRRLERDCDFGDSALHGADGPVAIRRHGAESWPPLSQALHDHARAQDIPFIADMNGDFRDGLGAVPISSTRDIRQSSAICYLDAAVRRRSNLEILCAARVTGLLREDRRITGVRVERAGLTAEHRARGVILSAGAIASPALLMRAGIGPADHLRGLGIEVLADVPMVGGNLQNHLILFFCGLLRRGMEQPAALKSHASTALRYSSGIEGGMAADMYTSVYNRTAWHRLGRRLATVTASVMKPHARGTVRLASADPRDAPMVEQNLLSDERDLRRLMQGVRDVGRLVASPEISALTGRFYPVFLGDRLRRLNTVSRRNGAIAAAATALIDLVPALGDPMMRFISAGRSIDELLADPELLRAHVRANIAGMSHFAGTCRMGRDDGAVVDPLTAQVKAVGGLRVVDASVMPTIPSGNTNLPTQMLAEKFADAIRRNPIGD